ncbi:MAG: CBS domain-containing protein [Aliiglaciecola sp.]
MSLTVSAIMSKKLIKLAPHATLHDAHEITRKQSIRHLPVVDPKTNKLVALVTQKDLITHVIRSIALYGTEELLEREKSTNILEVAQKDFASVSADQPLDDVAPFFLQNKHGCLPVIDPDKGIIGIVTSSDFVKLCVQLLQDIKDKGKCS